MRLLLVLSLVIAAVAPASSGNVCQTTNGKKLITFSGTKEWMKFPCKYDAIRNTVCGNWKILVSPGNMLEIDQDNRYVIKTLFVGVVNMQNNQSWEGRTDLQICRKFLDGVKSEPFNKKSGSLETSDIFVYGDQNDDTEVSLTEKSGDFKITFYLYEPHGAWHRSSGFKFECFSSNFRPSGYPTQLCGNGTKMEVREFKKAMDWKDSRQASIFYNIFSDMNIVQTDSECQSVQKTMSSQCPGHLKYESSRLCSPILSKRHIQSRISQNMDSPLTAFRHCVEFVCSNYSDMQACKSLGEIIDYCPKLDVISQKVRNTCKEDLYTS